MITSLVRPASIDDHQRLSNLIFFETRLHRHLDWRTPLEWLGAPFYWALDDGMHITAALACPEETEGIAWVRLFVHAAEWTTEGAWNMLWRTAREEIAGAGGARVAVIAMQAWFQQALAASGFENRQSIVMLEWHGYSSQPWVRSEAEVRIRQMGEADLSEIHQIDAAAFDPLWRNSFETLSRAFRQSLIATVAEDDDGVVGYQLSTGGGQRAHLARLAVHPARQGRGIGRALLSDLFTKLTGSGIHRLSVNTQDDNAASLRLYRGMGFLRTGEQYPVLVYDVHSD